MTIQNDDSNKKGFIKNIHWRFVPRVLILILSTLFGWAIFWKRDS